MIIRKTINNIKPYQEGKRLTDAIKMSSNENAFGASAQAISAAKQTLQTTQIYPNIHSSLLKEQIAEHHSLKTENVITGNGSSQVLTFIAGAYINPQETVIIGRHTFSQYAFVSQLFDGDILTAPMPHFRFSLSEISRMIRENTKIIFLASPNNPTGYVIPHKDICAFLADLPTSVLLVMDHAYQEYTTDTNAFYGVRLLDDFPNLILLHTFSKLYGLASMRVGYGLACRDRIAEMHRTCPPFSVNAAAQAAAQAALQDKQHIRSSLAMNKKGIARLYKTLDTLGIPYLQTQANFITIDISRVQKKKPAAKTMQSKKNPQSPAYAAAQWFAEHGITVRPLDSFCMPNYLRITIGTSTQMRIFIDLLSRFVHEA